LLLNSRQARLRVDVRNASQLVGPLVPLRLVDRLKTVVWVLLAIPLRDIGAGVPGVRPVSGADPTFQRILLAQKILLRCIRDGHVACVDAEAGLARLGAEVVVGSSRVPEEEVTGLGAQLLPGAAVVGEPLHAGLGVAVPFVGPGWDPLLVLHRFVELLGELGAAFADDETAVFGAVGQKIDQTLQAAEAGLEGVLGHSVSECPSNHAASRESDLVLVRPWYVLGDVGSAGSGMSATMFAHISSTDTSISMACR
jgi:hypothetical protein